MLILRDHIDREGRGSRCRLCKREGEIALGAFARAAEGGAAGCCSSSDGSRSPHYIRQWQLQHMVHLRPHLLVFFEIDPGDGCQLVGRRGFMDDMKYLKWFFSYSVKQQALYFKDTTSSGKWDTIQHTCNKNMKKWIIVVVFNLAFTQQLSFESLFCCAREGQAEQLVAKTPGREGDTEMV